jgi:hypothetical protein
VGRLLERAETLPASGRGRLLARAEHLLETYATRVPVSAPKRRLDEHDREWREVLEARARRRPPPRARARSAALLAEIRAAGAAARAADQVPESAGPYHGAAVASRALEELAALAPGYVSSYLALLEDLACLMQLPERRGGRRRP